MKYCTRCGTAVDENAKFCTNCGTPTSEAAQQTNYPYPPGSATGSFCPANPVEKLSGRLRVSAILLLITAIMQIIGGLSSIGVGIGMLFAAVPWVGSMINQYGAYIGEYTYYDYDFAYISEFGTGAAIAACIICIVAGAFAIAVCIVNFIASKRAFNYIKQIQRSPAGIVQHFQSAGKPIAVLVLNILSGGAIGIVGAAFGLAARCYVTGNRQQFLDLEKQVR